jgi:hypothetical protein
MQVQLRCFYIKVAQYVINMPGAYPFFKHTCLPVGMYVAKECLGE